MVAINYIYVNMTWVSLEVACSNYIINVFLLKLRSYYLKDKTITEECLIKAN